MTDEKEHWIRVEEKKKQRGEAKAEEQFTAHIPSENKQKKAKQNQTHLSKTLNERRKNPISLRILCSLSFQSNEIRTRAASKPIHAVNKEPFQTSQPQDIPPLPLPARFTCHRRPPRDSDREQDGYRSFVRSWIGTSRGVRFQTSRPIHNAWFKLRGG